jgi:hypothetical protein
MSTINLLIYWVGLHPAPGYVVHFICRCVEIKKRTFISYIRLVHVIFRILHSFGICGTYVPPTTGHLPIAFEAVILYDNHNLGNETRSLPGSGVLLMICKS